MRRRMLLKYTCGLNSRNTMSLWKETYPGAVQYVALNLKLLQNRQVHIAHVLTVLVYGQTVAVLGPYYWGEAGG